VRVDATAPLDSFHNNGGFNEGRAYVAALAAHEPKTGTT
jgi:hypothetical protein